MSSSKSGGELVGETLRTADVDVVFGVLSVHNLPIFDALDAGGVRLVLARTESGAVAMADGYARATGRLGVALTSTGVGAANAAGCLLESYTASVPVLHITGQVDAALVDQEKGALHAAKDQLTMLRSVGKEALRAARTESIPAVLSHAMRVAQAGRPGPVSVEIPVDQQYREVDTSVADWMPPPRVAPDADALERAAALVRGARRPLIWAGGGIVQAGASDALRALAEGIGAGVITTQAGRGSIPEDHPLCIGNFSLEDRVAELYAQSDLMLVVGSRLRGNETRTWQLPLPRPLIQVDVEPTLLGRNYPVDLGVAGDARLVLESLARTRGGAADPNWSAQVADVRSAVRVRWRGMLGERYELLLDDLRAGLPRDAIVVRDVTVPATSWGSRLLETYLPRTTIHSATLSIGQGLPMAIGAAVGQPSRQVVLLAGDGGFVMTLGELATAVQEELAVTSIVFNDGGYGILRNLQDAYLGGRRFGVDLDAPDFAGVGRAFTARGGSVAAAAELRPLLEECLTGPGPAVIDVDLRALGPTRTPFTGAARLIPERVS